MNRVLGKPIFITFISAQQGTQLSKEYPFELSTLSMPLYKGEHRHIRLIYDAEVLEKGSAAPHAIARYYLRHATGLTNQALLRDNDPRRNSRSRDNANSSSYDV